MAKEVKIKIPKTIGACADRLYLVREERLKLAKDVAKMEAEESALKEHIVNILPKSDSSGAQGKVARVSVGTKVVPSPRDWELIMKYIKKNDAFDLLQRRLNTAAVEERWANKKEVPGVEKFTAVTVSINKL